MALVTTKKLLIDAQQKEYAVPAFNVENMEMAMAVVTASEEMSSPVIIQTTSSTVKYASLRIYQSIVNALAEQVKIPVAIHLDHGVSFQLAKEAMEAGYTSIMIDGSHYCFEENIIITKSVVEIAKAKSIPVEGELGKVGGKEDEIDGGDVNKNTDPKMAAEFVKRTGIDSLAIAIGTSHGLYKGTPKIDIIRLKEIKKIIDIPLVLHGTSGVDDQIVKECVKSGICKVNYATELRIAFSNGIKEILNNDNSVYDPKVYGRIAMEKVKAVVRKNIGLCFSENRAK